jgi:DNA polymerase-2
VAERLLGRRKLIEEPAGKIEEIRRLFREDRPALAAYNLEDCRLVEAIFEKANLIDFAVQRAVMTRLPLGRQGGSVAAFDNLYLPRLHRAGTVAPDLGTSQATESSPGGYVMDSQPGLYDNVLVLDFKSLYPSIIRTFRIDPLGLARPGEDPVPGFLGAGFSRDGSILPAIITELWGKRDAAKREANRALTRAIKIIMNSFYGVLDSGGCRFFDPRLASSITRRGHEIIQRSRDHIEAQGYRVIYGDTDSVFVLLGPDYT